MRSMTPSQRPQGFPSRSYTANLSTPRVWRAGKWLSLATLVALALLVAGVRGPNGVAVNLAQAAGLDAAVDEAAQFDLTYIPDDATAESDNFEARSSRREWR